MKGRTAAILLGLTAVVGSALGILGANYSFPNQIQTPRSYVIEQKDNRSNLPGYLETGLREQPYRLKFGH